jgi:hypothetical protein
MGWMQPAHFSFLHGLDVTSPFCFFFMGWMQPAHFSFLHNGRMTLGCARRAWPVWAGDMSEMAD